jgi:hypothetical protein
MRTSTFSTTLCPIKKKANRTNSTFGFLPTHKPTQKKPKELFYPNAQLNKKIKIANLNYL